MNNEIMEIIDDAYLDLCLDSLVDRKPYQIRLRKNFETACWSYVKGKHIIFIGDKILEGCKKDIENYDEYIVSYLYHEVAHSLHTERDLKMVSEALKMNKIPFAIFNLAEDARIEHIMRNEANREFNWSKYEELQEPLTPIDFLFNITQNDGDVSSVDDMPDSEKVIEFYGRFCAAKTSLDVLEILIDWMKEFKNTEQDIKDLQDKLEQQDCDGEKSSCDSGESKSKSGSKPTGEAKEGKTKTRALEDLAESIKLAEDEEALECALEESEVISGQKDAVCELAPEVEVNLVSISEHSNTQVISDDEPEDWDVQNAKKLAKHFEPLFQEKSSYINSKRQSKRINKKAFRFGSTSNKYYKAKETLCPSKKTLTIIVDCSGSMYRAMKDMRVVCGVFNELAKSRFVSGNIILSGVNNGKSIYETFALPVSDDIIGRFYADYGAEGLEGAIKSNIDLLKKSDHIFILTDGCICDQPISKEKYHLMGLYTVGVYIGESDDGSLTRWFDKGIVVNSLEHCADALVSHLGEK